MQSPADKVVFDAALVRRLASLSRLALTPEEETAFAAELTRVLDHVAELGELDLEGVTPLTWASEGGVRLRDDEPRPSLEQKLALREAPRADADGFVVPSFVDEG
jgi:aspartyl-tRNA(Asn)/glutamyl-tRNA(Gln) amidotransferase subunit C